MKVQKIEHFYFLNVLVLTTLFCIVWSYRYIPFQNFFCHMNKNMNKKMSEMDEIDNRGKHVNIKHYKQ